MNKKLVSHILDLVVLLYSTWKNPLGKSLPKVMLNTDTFLHKGLSYLEHVASIPLKVSVLNHTHQ